jgi:hypothetical protein
MRRLSGSSWIAAAMLMMLSGGLTGCGGSGFKDPLLLLACEIVQPTAPLEAGVETQWSVQIHGGVAPYSVHWDFGGGAEINTADVGGVQPADQTSSSITATLLAGDWIAAATVTDAHGTVSSDTALYTVGPPPALHAAATLVAGNIMLSASGPLETELTVTASAPEGLFVGAPEYRLINGGRGAVLPVGARNPLTGASGSVTLTVADSSGAQGVTQLAVSIAPLVLAADTLYAIPIQRSVRAGEPVDILIATGPTTDPLQYVMLGLTFPDDGKYVYGSFNHGAPGGNRDGVDGLWTAMGATGFLTVPEGDGGFLPYPGIGGGRVRFDMSATPLGGRDLQGVGGALCCLQVKFSRAGTKELGFQQLATVKRTYFASSTAEFYWHDIGNSQAGSPRSVAVY